jgi:16S rRNA (cytosine1402-N4)-methyltransferase
VVEALAPHEGGIYLDVTVGAGGHSEALLRAGAGRLIGTDRDSVALELAGVRLAPFGERVSLHRSRFSWLDQQLDELGVDRVDGLVADLGVSSMQLDDAGRGMSFRAEGPLDMRMDGGDGETALELIERLSDDDLTEVIAKLGEERRARRVARCIKQALEAGKLTTTTELRRAVVRAVGPQRVGGIDPATRTFQALRMAVNRELDELDALLTFAAERIAPGGRVAIIAFHSLEDRMVKRSLRDGDWEVMTRRPIKPGDAECDDNPRARSARLRVGTRPGGSRA